MIWRVKISWRQKLALASTLCLTILTILCTITRIAGIHTGRTVKSIDSVWGTYWQFIAANIALIMTSATAFRTFFVSRGDERAAGLPRSKETWFSRGQRLLRYAFAPRSWRSKHKAQSSGDDSGWYDHPIELPQEIPRATITGIRTFINGHGKTKMSNSQLMQSAVAEEHEDSWPLSAASRSAPGIAVQHEFSTKIEGV